MVPASLYTQFIGRCYFPMHVVPGVQAVRYARYGISSDNGDPEIAPISSLEDPDLQALLANWVKLKNARPVGDMPLRAVASADIGRLLKFTHLCDVIDGGRDFRFRIVGIAAFPELEPMTGKLVSEHPDPGYRHRFPFFMREVVRTAAPVRGMAFRRTPLGTYRMESLWLPFGMGTVQQILGLLAPRDCKVGEDYRPAHQERPSGVQTHAT